MDFGEFHHISTNFRPKAESLTRCREIIDVFMVFCFFCFCKMIFVENQLFCKKLKFLRKVKKITKVATLTWSREIIGILVLNFMNFMNFSKFH